MATAEATTASKVVLVVKPKPTNEQPAWKVLDGKLIAADPGEEFELNAALSNPDESHADFYAKHISQCLTSSTDSNITVLAYGLPNSGKTYCTIGTPSQHKDNPDAQGIIVRCMEQNMETSNVVTGSYCHVFNDGRVKDLLDTKGRCLKVEERKSGLPANEAANNSEEFFINGCTKAPLRTPNDVAQLIWRANIGRNATGVVKAKLSSGVRSKYKPHSSHAIFQYYIERTKDSPTNGISGVSAAVSTITIIELAGQCIESYCNGVPTSGDIGIDALHCVLEMVSKGDVQGAKSMAKSTSLTSLLYSSVFGNSKCLVVSTLPLDNSDSAARKALQYSLLFKNVSHTPSSYSSPLALALPSTSTGETAMELNGLETVLVKKSISSNDEAVSGQQIASINDSSELINGNLDKAALGDNNKTNSHRDPISDIPTTPNSTTPLKDNDYGTSSHKVPTDTPTTASNTTPISPVTTDTPTMASNTTPISPLKKSPPLLSGTQSPMKPPTLTLAAGSPLKPITKPTLLSSPPPDTQGGGPLTSMTLQSKLPLRPPPIPVQGTNQHAKPLHVTPMKQGKSFQTRHLVSNAINNPLKQPQLNKLTTVPPTLQDMNKEAISDTSSDSDAERVDHKKQEPTKIGRTSLTPAPPPLNAIPHVKPAAVNSSTSTPRVSLTQENQDEQANKETMPSSLKKNQLGQKEAKHLQAAGTGSTGGGSVMELKKRDSSNVSGTLSSSSGSSIRNKDKSQKKKRIRKKRANSRAEDMKTEKTLQPEATNLSDTIPHTHTSPSEEDDTFDPDFKPGQLTMRPTAYASVPQRAIPSLEVTPMGVAHQLPSQLPMGVAHQLPQPSMGVAHQLPHPQLPMGVAHQLPQLQMPVQNSPSPITSNHQNGSAAGQLPQLKQIQSNSSKGGSNDSTAVHQQKPQQPEEQEPGEIHYAAAEGIKSSHLKHLVMKYGVDFTDKEMRTPLMYAVMGNQPKMCEVLLSCDANINAIDASNNTALLWAAIQSRPEIIRILLKYGADVTHCDSEGNSVFHWAMRTPVIKCLKILCKYPTFGMENKTNKEGLTPLHYAISTEQPEHIKMFLKLLPSVQVNPLDTTGCTPLIHAVLNFSPICIQALIAARGLEPVHFRDQDGRTGLHYACAEGSADCIRSLLECKGCNIHAKDNEGRIPLHFAAAANQPGIIQLLLRRNVDKGQVDNMGKTPLDHAKERNNEECVKILENYGLRRPASAWSIASLQSPIRPPTPPELDETGHVPMKSRLSISNLRGSLFGKSNNSSDRSPGDGGNTEPPESSIVEKKRNKSVQQDSNNQSSMMESEKDTIKGNEQTIHHGNNCPDETVDGLLPTPSKEHQPNGIDGTVPLPSENQQEKTSSKHSLKNNMSDSVENIRQSNRFIELLQSCIPHRPRRHNTIHPLTVPV